MILFGKVRSICLARYKIDFRKSHWSLLAEAYALGLDPLQGDLIFFTSDPSQAQFLVSLVAVGYQTIEACQGLGALEKTDYQNLRD
ncbi:MAG: hypothetical protein H7318_03890 [Oligoflexus sp.]|nr:hypothetical protein [Oligoflexus sp.]